MSDSLATPWTVAYQALPSMGFTRQEYWSELPFPSPGDLPNPGIEPRSPTLWADALTSEPPGKPCTKINLEQCEICREEWEDLPMASFLSLKSYFLGEDFLDQFYLFFFFKLLILSCCVYFSLTPLIPCTLLILDC